MGEHKDITDIQDAVASSIALEYYKESPPPFGHDMLRLFAFEPGYVNLNHGGCRTI